MDKTIGLKFKGIYPFICIPNLQNMALKLLKGVWFLSMAVALGVLLYVYASLPQEVVIQDEPDGPVSVSNETVFYTAMVLMAIANVLVYVIGKVFKANIALRTWFHGLVTTLNVFFIVGLNFIALFNSNERYDYQRISFIIYGSVALMLLWAFAWPVYLIFRRTNFKQ
jgi:hypothetical protein